jgi:hypothetical protein
MNARCLPEQPQSLKGESSSGKAEGFAGLLYERAPNRGNFAGDASFNSCQRSMMFFAIVLLFGVTLAQRPNNASICDYYAMNLYGANTTETQSKLMQGIVSLAFCGGAGIPNVSSEITGILNPGNFNGEPVNLHPWFDGSIDSTNLNNIPVEVDWLDGGGTEPLLAFLNGTTETVQIKNDTNELYVLPFQLLHF